MQGQQATQQAPAINFNAGCGVVRSKSTADAVMYFGKYHVPGRGQCYIRGHRMKSDTEAKLELQHEASREVIATLLLPAGQDKVREAKLKVVGTKKPYIVRMTIRSGQNGAYGVLNTEGVKAVGSFE